MSTSRITPVPGRSEPAPRRLRPGHAGLRRRGVLRLGHGQVLCLRGDTRTTPPASWCAGRPTTPTFNGTVIVEWLNVSGGIDAPAVWFMAHREIARAGYAYVAVSAQHVGVEGGDSLIGADMSLKAQDPERYSPLHHPGDQFSYDIYSQVGRLIRDGAVDGLEPKSHSRGGGVAVGDVSDHLRQRGGSASPRSSTASSCTRGSVPRAPLAGGSALEASRPAPFRDDLRVPVLSVITETDLVDGHLLGYHHARRPDNDRLRVWEIPGTAHADNYTIRVGFIDNGSRAAGRHRRGVRTDQRADGNEACRTASTSPPSTTTCCRRAIARPEQLGPHRRARTHRAPHRPDRRGHRLRWSSTSTGSPAAGCARPGSTSRSRGHRAWRPTRAPCRSCSARGRCSTTTPCAGSIPAARRTTSNASPQRWIGRSTAGRVHRGRGPRRDPRAGRARP